MCVLCLFCSLYYHLFNRAYGETEVTAEAVQQYVEVCNAEMRSVAAAVCASDPDENENFIKSDCSSDAIIIAICTPLMKCVHKMIPHSGELVFMDAGGNMDRQNTRVFLLLTHSAAGGLPLGVLIVSNEQCNTISAALHLYMTLLDGECFGGRGATGPVIFMTDDSAAERNALNTVFPESTLLLCAFHMLQAYWRFLWDHKSNVKKEHRQQLFAVLKCMLYASSGDHLDECFSNAVCDPLLQLHPKLLAHVQSLYDRRSEWALNGLRAAGQICQFVVITPTTTVRAQWGWWKTRYCIAPRPSM